MKSGRYKETYTYTKPNSKCSKRSIPVVEFSFPQNSTNYSDSPRSSRAYQTISGRNNDTPGSLENCLPSQTCTNIDRRKTPNSQKAINESHWSKPSTSRDRGVIYDDWINTTSVSPFHDSLKLNSHPIKNEILDTTEDEFDLGESDLVRSSQDHKVKPRSQCNSTVLEYNKAMGFSDTSHRRISKMVSQGQKEDFLKAKMGDLELL